MPMAMRSPATIHDAIAPALFSHLPESRPTTLIVTANARPTSEKTMKYALLVDHDCHPSPPRNRRFPAAKYSSDGKYGRLVAQYDQALRNAEKGPNARLLQT